MHIVYVTGHFAEREKEVLAGMENYIYKTAKAMIMRGHEVTILTIGRSNKAWTYDGIPVVSRRVNQGLGVGVFEQAFNEYILSAIDREFVFNKTLEEIDKKKKISLVQYAGWFGVGMLYNGKYPSILRISTYVKEQLFDNYTEKEIKYITWCERMAAKRFNGIIAPSKALGEPYSRDTGRKVLIIETAYKSNILCEEDRSLYEEMLKDKKYYLFFGRITLDKGIETIAKAIYNILDSHKDVYFVMAGAVCAHKNRNLLKEVYQAAREHQDRVIFLGSIPHSQLNPIIKSAQGVLLPSVMDNLPNAGLESMALNGILVGTRGASFDEMFTDKVSGLLIDINDSKGLEESVNYIENMSNEQKEKMRQNAKKALFKFSPERAYDKLIRYYKYILENC